MQSNRIALLLVYFIFWLVTVKSMLDDSLLFMETIISLIKTHYIYPIIAEGVKDLSQVYVCDTVPLSRFVLGIQFFWPGVVSWYKNLDTVIQLLVVVQLINKSIKQNDQYHLEICNIHEKQSRCLICSSISFAFTQSLLDIACFYSFKMINPDS